MFGAGCIFGWGVASCGALPHENEDLPHEHCNFSVDGVTIACFASLTTTQQFSVLLPPPLEQTKVETKIQPVSEDTPYSSPLS
jgi:hypothetical protein